MLQVDPRRRITVKQLLRHPWLIKGYGHTVSWRSKFKKDHVDDDCVTELAVHHGKSKTEMKEMVSEWKYDYLTATYLLLLSKKIKGRPIRLISQKALTERQRMGSTQSVDLAEVLDSPYIDSTPSKPSKRHSSYDDDEYKLEFKENFLIPETPRTPRGKRPPTYGKSPPPSCSSSRKKNRPTTPPPMSDILAANVDCKTPCRAKRALEDQYCNTTLSPSRSMDSQLNNLSMNMAMQTPVSENKITGGSVDTELDRIHFHVDTPVSKGTRKGSVFGSIERGIDKMITMLTPKKKQPGGGEGPRRVKATHNVSNTCQHGPDYMLHRLKTVMVERKIAFKQHGYMLRCCMNDDWGKTHLAFDLEVVQINKMNLVGVRRKRVQGNTWHYKRLCEDILSAAKL